MTEDEALTIRQTTAHMLHTLSFDGGLATRTLHSLLHDITELQLLTFPAPTERTFDDFKADPDRF